MATQASTAELVAALWRIDGKAEIVGGEIVLMSPTVYRRGDLAEAEPALPGWTFPVDEIFD